LEDPDAVLEHNSGTGRSCRDEVDENRRRSIETPEETMKMHLVAIAGLVISSALPTFAQQKEPTPREQDRQWLGALLKKFDDAWNNNDAAVLAALYTDDAVIVTNTGPIYGRDAIEKHFADLFKQFHFQQPSRQGRSVFPPDCRNGGQ
jgi:hypothetical protein